MEDGAHQVVLKVFIVRDCVRRVVDDGRGG